MLIALTMLVSCQQSEIVVCSDATTRSITTDTITFCNSYIWWDEEQYMMDYSIIGEFGNPPLDAELKIPYKVTTDTGYSQTFYFVFAEGSSNIWEEGTTLGESLITEMGLDSNYSHIISFTVLPYLYAGNMTIIGLDALNTPGGTTSSSNPNALSAEWLRGSYNIGGELKEMNYFNSEGGMGVYYSLCSQGYIVLETKLTNIGTNALTINASDFALVHRDGSASPYQKIVSIYLSNSSSSIQNNLTLAANESKIVYLYSTELFLEKEGYCYDTTPPFDLSLLYKGKEIVTDDLSVSFNSSWEGWIQY